MNGVKIVKLGYLDECLRLKMKVGLRLYEFTEDEMRDI